MSARGQDQEKSEVAEGGNPDPLTHQPYYTLFVTLYALVILAAFVGNALIISTVGARVRELSVPRNILIINLAAADLCE